MIKSGVYAVCDQCSYEDKIPTMDHIPGSWFVLHTVAGNRPGVPQVCYHLCSEECVINFMRVE